MKSRPGFRALALGCVVSAAFSSIAVEAVASRSRLAKARALETGQRVSYGAARDTTAGLGRILVDLGNGVVKDRRTGLFWEKKSRDGSIHDFLGEYTWSSDLPNPRGATGTAFTEFLAALNTPPCFANHCDWRLPTLVEIETIRDLGWHPAVEAFFDRDCAPGCSVTECSCTRVGSYWTSTTDDSVPGKAWITNSYWGESGSSSKDAALAVRAVRGNPSPGEPDSDHRRFAWGRALETGQRNSFGAAGDTTAGMTRLYKDLGNGVIKDQRTGLFWEKKSDDGSIHDRDWIFLWSTGEPWGATGTAFSIFLADLNTPPCFGGFCDWRLPTLVELATIVDMGRATAGAAVAKPFDDGCAPGCAVSSCSCTAPDVHWTSTTFEDAPDTAWRIGFDNGDRWRGHKQVRSRVRAVRGGP